MIGSESLGGGGVGVIRSDVAPPFLELVVELGPCPSFTSNSLLCPIFLPLFLSSTSHTLNQTNLSKLFINQPTSIKMSAPNANAPNEGIVGQISNSISNAANYVSETVQGKVCLDPT